MTIQRKKVEGGTYPPNELGLELWDSDMRTLPESLAIIGVAGLLFVANTGLEQLGKIYPDLLITTARTDSQLELVVLERSSRNDKFGSAVNSGGYGLQNQERVKYLQWIWRKPEGNPGGH